MKYFLMLLIFMFMAVTAQTSNIVLIDDDSEIVAGLVEGFGELEPSTINGEIIYLYGQVLNLTGASIPNAVVEIWQTDVNGVYDHPQDRKTIDRDMSFQFFGSATTNSEGWYIFRTLLPGEYEPRPRHIHFKVKLVNNELLTSQFYFSEDVVKVEQEGMFQAIGDSGDSLLLQVYQRDSALWANGQIVVNAPSSYSNSENLALTPSQGEGPFYPVVNVGDFDNDLLTLP